MNKENKLSQPFIIVLVVTIVLLVVSFIDTKISILGFELKNAGLLSDIQLKKEKIVQDTLPVLIANEPAIFIDSNSIAVNPAYDSLANSIDFKTDTASALSHFFQALNATKKQKRKTRIAYFGDSMIEGDLITQDLRSHMQNKFGGYGVGFVPITSIVASFRSSVKHSFDGWTTYNLLEKPPENHMLGISGYGFVPNIMDADSTSNTDESWVQYSTVNKKHINKFYETKLLYGKSDAGNYVVINDLRYPLNGENTVNQLVIHDETPSKSIKAIFKCKTPIDVFGFSMESDSGVFVDNFSFRGNSGMPINRVLQSVYIETQKCLNYDLIILEYGLNTIGPDITDFSWYERGMSNVIKHLQTSFPNTSILLISVGDKSYRKDGIYETDPSVPILVETQKRMAQKNKIAFWSLYHAMGGYGSMVKWVEGDTILACKDYTHFNFRGAHKAGRLLYNILMGEYEKFNIKKSS